MTKDQIKQLLDRYFEGKTSLEEEEQLRKIFRQQKIPRDFEPFAPLFRYVHEASQQHDPKGIEDSAGVTGRDGDREINLFAKVDEAETGEGDRAVMFSISRNAGWQLRIAAGIILALTGFSAGLIVGSGTGSDSTDEFFSLQKEVDQIKNALVYDAYRQTPASERIQAVQLTTGMDEAGDQLIMILIHTMNNDPNVNVRLAAIDALRNYADLQGVRGAFVQALTVQNDPFVQLSLIDTLVEINERPAVSKMEKLLLAENVEPAVKDRIEEGIAELRM